MISRISSWFWARSSLSRLGFCTTIGGVPVASIYCFFTQVPPAVQEQVFLAAYSLFLGAVISTIVGLATMWIIGSIKGDIK